MADVDDIALPSGWAWTTIGQISQVNPGKSFVRDLSNDTEVTFIPMAAVDEKAGCIAEPQVRRLGDVRKGYTSFSEGDVLFAKITPCMENGKVAIARGLRNQIGFGSTEFHVLKPGSEVLAEWLYYFIRQSEYRNAAKANFSGTAGQLRVPSAFITDSKIPIAPIEEQRRIVSKIEELLTRLDAGVTALKHAQANLKRYKASVLKAACEGRLVPTEAELARAEERSYEPACVLLERILAERRAKWEAYLRAKGKDPSKVKYVEPQSPDTSGLPVLPEGWCWASVEQILAEPLANGRSITDAVDGFPVLRLTALRNGRIVLTERKIGAWTSNDARQFLVKRGDFLIARGNGSMTLIGRGGLVEDDPDPVAYPDTMIRIRPLSTVINARFLRAIWDVSSVRQQIERQSRTSAGIYKINQSSLHTIVLPIPPLSGSSDKSRQPLGTRRCHPNDE